MLVITPTNKDSSVVVHTYCSYCLFVSIAEGSEREQQYTRSYSGFGESYEEVVSSLYLRDCSLMQCCVCVCVCVCVCATNGDAATSSPWAGDSLVFLGGE